MPEELRIAVWFIFSVGITVVVPFFYFKRFNSSCTRSRFTDKQRYESLDALSIVAFLSLFWALSIGISVIFSGMEEYDNDVDYQLGPFVAFLVSISIGHVFSKFAEMRDENQRLSILVEAQKRKDDLRQQSCEALIVTRDKVIKALSELNSNAYTGDFTLVEEKELRVNELLLDELDYKINNHKQGRRESKKNLKIITKD